jgi:hypothetical protein
MRCVRRGALAAEGVDTGDGLLGGNGNLPISEIATDRPVIDPERVADLLLRQALPAKQRH